MPQEQAQLAILFADIAGSTQLYETLGDMGARSITAHCIDVMTETTRRHGGTLVKTIGDEVMTTFPTSDAAAEAACAMQDGITGRVVVERRPIAIRIGFHFGLALIEDGDVFGDSVNLPARIAAQAKGGQILTTGATVEHLSGNMRESCRQIDLAQIRGKQQQVAIYEVVWRLDDVTLMQASWVSERDGGRLTCISGDTLFELGEGFPSLTIGRAEQNDLVVQHPLVSRLHARIEYRNRRFVLVDQSANGTYISDDSGSSTFVRRDMHVLTGSGSLGLGEPVTPASRLRVRYEQG